MIIQNTIDAIKNENCPIYSSTYSGKKGQELAITGATVPIGTSALIGEVKQLGEVELLDVRLDQDFIPRLVKWADSHEGARLRVDRLRASPLRITTRGVEIPAMEADADSGADGAVRRIALRAARGNLSLVPAADGTARVSFSLREVSPPFGPPLLFQELAGEGLLKAGAFETTKLEGQIAGGALTGAARLSWSDGIAIDADFDLKNADTAEMLGMAARGFSATGSLALSGRLNLKAPTLDGLADTALIPL